MNKMEYMPVDCLQVPKVLFQMEKYKNLSNTAKILYSLFLDRLKFAVQNGWVDGKGDLYVIYPKSEMKKDLNTTRYGVCLLYTSPSPRDGLLSRMPSSA